MEASLGDAAIAAEHDGELVPGRAEDAMVVPADLTEKPALREPSVVHLDGIVGAAGAFQPGGRGESVCTVGCRAQQHGPIPSSGAEAAKASQWGRGHPRAWPDSLHICKLELDPAGRVPQTDEPHAVGVVGVGVGVFWALDGARQCLK